ncbi:MAG: Uma2 family endonuclease [Oculatellaceae cyanobacterium Prado106]|jgi:Uma2 family endonuclease|nr:Uma2 family endonuclease [Oculatellaceae cyanobacterium Prado106]
MPEPSLSAWQPRPLNVPLQTKGSLPTMYDLPSDDPEEPGLPDEFHALQPQLLSRTLQLSQYSRQEIFYALDMNLYYDPEHVNWYKRPDWFLVVGVPRRYQNWDARQSYVLWDEQVSPIVVVAFLSPGTEAEDLGRFATRPPKPSEAGKPPHKFEVYEQIVRVQNYIVYDETTEVLRYFRLIDGAYQEQSIAPTNPRLWIPELKIGLAIAPGEFDGLEQCWLRWCDRSGTLLPTDTEMAIAQEAAARQREIEANQRTIVLQAQVQQTVKNLLAIGMSEEQVAQVTGMSEAEVRQIAMQD